VTIKRPSKARRALRPGEASFGPNVEYPIRSYDKCGAGLAQPARHEATALDFLEPPDPPFCRWVRLLCFLAIK
ncbi:MAG TPA: hypothetical protein VLE19_17630, partial [Pyrinomonadaceae bacterium]|nr:hypothetical protein [Pyrinomonadaceae bacterium]